jgi:hypothetical protein
MEQPLKNCSRIIEPDECEGTSGARIVLGNPWSTLTARAV